MKNEQLSTERPPLIIGFENDQQRTVEPEPKIARMTECTIVTNMFGEVTSIVKGNPYNLENRRYKRRPNLHYFKTGKHSIRKIYVGWNSDEHIVALLIIDDLDYVIFDRIFVQDENLIDKW